MKTIVIFLCLVAGTYLKTWAQAHINWQLLDRNVHTTLLVEPKSQDTQEVMIKMRRALYEISDLQGVGIILQDGKIKKFVTAASSRDPQVLENIKKQIRNKLEGIEIIITQKSVDELKTEYASE
ncbi:MAG: hypothetical protein RML72_06075 [Bacteroidia bacterium]|nr:hypothetical protein [Bacteroidia bacterium]MDW8158427.1 hypothetical protein [Bacteroidia bacterium]